MTEKARITVPIEGVRKDVSEMLHTPTQMSDAVNVIVYKGDVRPRPAMTRLGFSSLVTNWRNVLTSHTNPDVFCVFAQYLLAHDDDGWEFSINNGTTWNTCTVNGLTESAMRVINLRGTDVLIAIGTSKLFTADVSSFPTPSTITFTELGTWRSGIQPLFDKSDPWFYDETNDILWFQNWKYGQYSAKIFALNDASASTSGTFSTDFASSTRLPVSGATSAPMLAGYSADATEEACWTRAAGESVAQPSPWLWHKWDFTDMQGDGDGNTAYAANWSTEQWFSMLEEQDGTTYSVKALTGSGLVSFTYTPNVLQNPFLTLISEWHQGAQFSTWAKADSTSEIIVGLGNVRTDNSWTGETRFEDFPERPGFIIYTHAVEGGNSYYFTEYMVPRGNGTIAAYSVHGQAVGTGVAGDPTIGNTISIFQGDLDAKPSTLFLGNTATILRLDRDTYEWEDVSPLIGDYGGTVQISGSEDSNRWVWRQAEKGSDRYILATNGQCAPLKISDGFDEFLAVGDALENGTIQESLAPIAKCMALANNRLVLGNLAADTEYSIRISDPQDFDNGYDDEYKLADTTGEIVSMKELNAITIAILKEDAIYHGISQVEFMGVSAPMRFELIKAGIVGPCSDASVVYLPDGRLCWLGRDGGVYIYDGTVPRDAGRHIRHMVYPLLDTDRFGWAWGVVDTKRNMLWFFFPTKTEPYGMNTGICMSIDQGEVWPCWMVQFPLDWEVMSGINVFTETDAVYGDFPRTPYGDMAVTPYNSFEGGKWEIMFARRNNTVYEQVWDDNGDYTDGGYPIYVEMLTGWYDFDDLYSFDTFHEMHHLINLQSAEELNWELQSEQSDRTILKQSKTLQSTNARHRTSYRQTGRRHRFRMFGWIKRMFHWGGAEGRFTRRGGR